MKNPPVLALYGIAKAFGGVKALDGVDFELAEGEIHGLVGENGAGKSTLMKILSGVHTRYDGQIRLRGQTVRFKNPRSAQNHGIGMIYQELSCIGALSVAENLFLTGQPRNRAGLIDWRAMLARAKARLEELSIDLDVRRPLEDLPFALQQMVEIARVVHSGAGILIMDEPTSALSPKEAKRLFGLMQGLKEQGKSIIFISHSIDDVLSACDRITVLRNGRKVAAFETAGSDKHFVLHRMLGENAKELEESYEEEFEIRSDESAPVVLDARRLGKGARVRDVSFVVREGEILGLYGAIGAGHELIGECLYGLERFDTGEVRLDGRSLEGVRPPEAKTRGLAYVAADRAASLFLDAEIYKNISIAFLRQIVPFPLRKSRETRIADEMVDRLGVKTPSSSNLLRNLSGGNQQKVAIARWLVHPVRLLILNEPTRGMDIGAKEEVMRIVKELKAKKVALLLISSEPETIIANSDRILVFGKGRIRAEFHNQGVSKDTLMRQA